MANKQIFKLHDVAVNGVDLGGVGAMGLTIQDVAVASNAHGAFGQEHDSSIFNRLLANITTFDVDQIGAVMAATPAQVIAKNVEAGLDTDTVYTVGGEFIITGVTARFPVGGIASMDLSGEFRWGADDAIGDMIIVTTGVGAAATNVPNRYLKPGSVLFGAQALKHVQEITFSAQARTAVDMADTNNGPEALDIIEWSAPRVQITFKDASVTAAVDMQQTLVALGEELAGVTASLVGMGATSDKTLTILNVRFRQGIKTLGEEYGVFTVEGVIPILNDAGDIEHGWNVTDAVGPPVRGKFIEIAA